MGRKRNDELGTVPCPLDPERCRASVRRFKGAEGHYYLTCSHATRLTLDKEPGREWLLGQPVAWTGEPPAADPAPAPARSSAEPAPYPAPPSKLAGDGPEAGAADPAPAPAVPAAAGGDAIGRLARWFNGEG